MKALAIFMSACAFAGTVFSAETLPKSYGVIKSFLDKVPAIDTHDHLWEWEKLPGWRAAEDGTKVMNLVPIWQNSYLNWFRSVPGWQPREKFTAWWERARPGFADVRAMSVYRYTLPALKDLYGVNFEGISDAQAAAWAIHFLRRWWRRLVHRCGAEGEEIGAAGTATLLSLHGVVARNSDSAKVPTWNQSLFKHSLAAHDTQIRNPVGHGRQVKHKALCF